MADVVSPEVRSRMMSGIKGKNTKPELLLRRGLHRMGFRFRVHDRRLPGAPDLVFPKYRAVIFVHGCFWHGHNCHLFKWPSSRPEFWKEKIERNCERDQRTIVKLRESGWRVLNVWECAFKGKGRINKDSLTSLCSDWLEGTDLDGEIAGASNG